MSGVYSSELLAAVITISTNVINDSLKAVRCRPAPEHSHPAIIRTHCIYIIQQGSITVSTIYYILFMFDEKYY